MSVLIDLVYANMSIHVSVLQPKPPLRLKLYNIDLALILQQA